MDIIEAIKQEYDLQIIPCWLLTDILSKCGYSQREISEIIREAINKKKMGYQRKGAVIIFDILTRTNNNLFIFYSLSKSGIMNTL